MPERDAERDDEPAITLSGLLGETPEQAARRPLPPQQLKGSPKRSLLLVGFSAIVVACLVALGALVTHSGGLTGFYPDRRTSGVSGGDTAEPGDLTPDLATPGPPAHPTPTVPGRRHGSASAPGPAAGAGSASGPRSAAGDPGNGQPDAGVPDAGTVSPTNRSASGSGAGSGDAPEGNPPGADARRSGGAGGDPDSAGQGDRRDRGDRPAATSRPGDRRGDRSGGPTGGGLLEPVASVLDGLTDAIAPGALRVKLTDSWHDDAGHDHSGRGGGHPGLRAAPAGIAPGLRLPGR